MQYTSHGTLLLCICCGTSLHTFLRLSFCADEFAVTFNRLVEEADYQNTSELFGGKTRGGRSLEDFIPKSEDDFLEYAELLAQKIRPFEVFYMQSHLMGVIYISI